MELDGKQLTIPQLTLYKQSTDPAMRRKAYEAEAVYFDAHRAEFDEIYDKMVKNRNEQARILGYNDYSELSYIRMNASVTARRRLPRSARKWWSRWCP